MESSLLLLLVAFGLVLLNGFFVAAEFALVKVRHTRIRELAETGNWRAKVAVRLVSHLDAYLSATQLGITLASIGLGWIGEPAVAHLIEGPLRSLGVTSEAVVHSISFGVAFAIVAFLHIVLGELAPKSIAIRKAEATSLWVSAPLLGFYYALYPFIALLNGAANALLHLIGIPPASEGDEAHTGEELRMIVAASRVHLLVDPTASRIMEGALAVVSRRAHELMVPRTEVVWLDQNMPFEELRILVGTSPYSNFPVCRGSLDDVVGVVHVKDMIAYGLIAGGNFKIANLAQRPLFVPEMAPAFKLLDQFQKMRMHVALVVDEHGAIRGLVTINDIMRALVGDLSRTGQPRPPGARRRDDGSWTIDGRMALRDVAPVLGLPSEALEDSPDVGTVAGLLLALLGRIPVAGDHITWQGWRWEVARMDGTRIDEVVARAAPRAAPESALNERRP